MQALCDRIIRGTLQVCTVYKLVVFFFFCLSLCLGSVTKQLSEGAAFIRPWLSSQALLAPERLLCSLVCTYVSATSSHLFPVFPFWD